MIGIELDEICCFMVIWIDLWIIICKLYENIYREYIIKKEKGNYKN